MARTATIRPAIADHGAMVAAIISTYGSATPEDIAAGERWYPAAEDIVRTIADASGMPADRVAFAVAALSPRNPWRWNVADAYAFAVAARAVLDGDARDHGAPSATTFAVNRERAWSMLVRESVAAWSTSAPKVRAFVTAILGDWTVVVVDTWAVRVATAGAIAEVTDAEYQRVADAYRDAAAMIGTTPREAQAVTWLVAQRAGLGSNRRGRHDTTFKRGTPDAVRALFRDGTAQ